MKKKLFLGFGILGLFIFGLILGLVWMNGQVRGLREIIWGQEIRIQGAEKQIPNVIRYTNVVRELTDKGKDKLTAFEIVEMARIIIVECQEHSDIGLTPDLIFGLIERESAFNPKAFSPARAYGITQCIEQTFSYHLPSLGYTSGFSEDLAFNPIVNLRVGIAELVRLRKLFLSCGVDDFKIVFSGYFWGERLVFELLESKKRVILPSLEYGLGVIKLAEKYRANGIL